MLYYRFYLEDSAGRIIRAEVATLVDDAEALNAARQISHPFTVSVWQQGRKVAEIAPTSGANPAARDCMVSHLGGERRS